MTWLDYPVRKDDKARPPCTETYGMAETAVRNTEYALAWAPLQFQDNPFHT